MTRSILVTVCGERAAFSAIHTVSPCLTSAACLSVLDGPTGRWCVAVSETCLPLPMVRETKAAVTSDFASEKRETVSW